jgi:glycosyltransferase involved in cell wall biosynthesis
MYFVLVISSKYGKEYSGSGLRAQKTYERLSTKVGLEYCVLANSEKIPLITSIKHGVRIGPLAIGSRYKVLRLLNAAFILICSVIHSIFLLNNIFRKKIILHTFGDSWSITYYTILFGIFGAPIIRELCNEVENPFYPKRLEKLITWSFRGKNSKIIAISPMLRDVALRYVRTDKIICRPNPITREFFEVPLNKRKTKVSELEKVRCLYIASMQDKKNQKFLLDVFELLPKKYNLLLMGPPNDLDYVASLKLRVASSVRLSDRVEILDEFCERPSVHMQNCDIYLFPSKTEGLGTPLLEAASLGLPIVANFLPGVSDQWIIDGKTGRVGPLNASVFADSIISVTTLDEEELLSHARYIRSVASSEVIDQLYISTMKQITNK